MAEAPALTRRVSPRRSILADRTSRNLFFFLCLNLSFAFVELLYGIWSNRYRRGGGREAATSAAGRAGPGLGSAPPEPPAGLAAPQAPGLAGSPGGSARLPQGSFGDGSL